MTELDAQAVVDGYVPRDDYFGPPYVDVWETRSAPAQHRFVHGGFDGTDTRFSFYLPPASRWAGRILTSVEGGPGGHESRAAATASSGVSGLGSVQHAFSLGAVLVESNGGHIAPPGLARSRGPHDGSITGHRATTESTRLARHVAGLVYGRLPDHGYIFGGSGGGWRTVLALENADDVWDGGVAYISPVGHGVSFPSVVGNAVRVLGPDIERVVAAREPGGSGDPFEALTNVQRTALSALYDAGLQPGAEAQLRHSCLELDVLLTTTGMHLEVDPAYFRDFWRVPGHLGADGKLDDDVVEVSGVVEELVTAAMLPGDVLDDISVGGTAPDPGEPVGVRVRVAHPGMRGAAVLLHDRAGRGISGTCVAVVGEMLVLDRQARAGLVDVAPGTEAGIDNHRYLAACHAYLHQLDPTASESQRFLTHGRPDHPQRPVSVADVLAGVRTTGRPHGRLVYVTNLQDTLASPLGGLINYIARVREAWGDAAGERLRVWVIEKAGHLPASARAQGSPPVLTTRLLDWHGVVERAVAELVAWTETGAAPPADTRFTLDGTRIVLPEHAADRLGIQPVVQLSEMGRTGLERTFAAVVSVPPGAGLLTAVEWDFDGTGTWPVRSQVETAEPLARFTACYSYDAPGVYYPAVRVTTAPTGDAAAGGAVSNLARTRVQVD